MPIIYSRCSMDSAPKKLDVVDKWRARVLFRDPPPAPDGWGKRMERQLAVLRVSFPFLTEKQLRGKAWTACGLRSLMGEIPRSGLSPKVKKEFMKRGKDTRFTMSPKLKIKKESPASDKKEAKLSSYSHVFSNTDTEILTRQNDVLEKALPQTPLSCLNPVDLLPANESNEVVNSYQALKKRIETIRLKPKRVDFDSQENSSLRNNVKLDDFKAACRNANLYCSQISKEKAITVVPTMDIYTPETIGDCLTTIQAEISNNMSEQSMILFSDHSSNLKPIEQKILQESNLYCTPCANASQNIQKSTELLSKNFDSTFFENTVLFTPQNYWSKTTAEDNNTDCSANTKLIDSEQSTTEEDQTFNNLNISISNNTNTNSISNNEDIDFFNLTQNYSLPSTPQETTIIPPLLSNLCCEYDLSCSKEEYKPMPLAHTNIVKKLKEDFDTIIPPDVSLMKYFEAEEKSFERIQSEVHQKVNSIIVALEEEESTETSKINI